MPAEGTFKYPPAGVTTSADPHRPHIPLKDAARALHMDRRTLQAAVVAGDIAGWARPGPQRLRWYVYEDQLTRTPPSGAADDDVSQLRGEVAELRAELNRLKDGSADRAEAARLVDAAREQIRAELAEATKATESMVADLRSQIVTLTESNLLLLEAQEELGGVTTTLESVGQKYRRALALFMTPGHPGELTDR